MIIGYICVVTGAAALAALFIKFLMEVLEILREGVWAE